MELFIHKKQYGVKCYQLFSHFSGNVNLLFQLAFLMTFFVFIVSRFYMMQHHHFDNFIITRISYAKYYRKSCYAVFCTTFIVMLLFHISMFVVPLLLHYHYVPYQIEREMVLFYGNMGVDIAIYMLLSSLGMGLFFMVLYAASYLIHNKYIYYVLPCCVIFCSLIVFVAISSFINGNFYITGKSLDMVRTICCMITPMNLYTPGLMFESYGWISFLSSCLLYVAAFIILTKLTTRMRMKYD